MSKFIVNLFSVLWGAYRRAFGRMWANSKAVALMFGVFAPIVLCLSLANVVTRGNSAPARATDAPRPVATQVAAPAVRATATESPTSTPNPQATALAEIAATQRALPTATNTPMPTATPTTIPATAQALATIAVRNAQATAGAFATADALAMRAATATVVSEKSNWGTIDIRDLVKDPEKYKTKRVAYSGQVFNIEESRGTYTMQIWVTGGNQREAVIVTHAGDSTGIYKDSFVRVYGVVFGAISGKNALGGTISQPGILAVYVDKQ